MLVDLVTALVWALFLWSGIVVTLHLYQNLGILVASQSSIMSLTALVDVILLRQGVEPLVAYLFALLVGAVLGLIHFPVFLQTKSALLLVLTAISQIVLVEVWYSIPQITGGSGGLLVPTSDVYETIIILTIFCIIVYSYLFYQSKAPRKKFDWACLRRIGLKSEAFGVPARRDYIFGFVVYGIILAAAGVSAARLIGSITVGFSGLTWSLTTLMIALAASSHSIFLGAILALLYSTIRVLLRQSVEASVAFSSFFEILFPAVLFFIISFDSFLLNDSTETDSTHTEEES